MTKPDKPMAAKGCGCGFVLTIVAVSYVLTAVFGLNDETAIYIGIAFGVLVIIGYVVNEFKAQTIHDSQYSDTKSHTEKPDVPRDEIACRFCGENILRVARKCKHCGSDLQDISE